MPPVGFEPTISAGERPQTQTLDCAATETGRAHYGDFILGDVQWWEWGTSCSHRGEFFYRVVFDDYLFIPYFIVEYNWMHHLNIKL